MTSPMLKLMIVSGIVMVTVAFSIGHRLSRISWTVASSTGRLSVGRCRDVGAEVLLRDLGERSVGAQFVQGLVDVGHQTAVLAGRERLLARVTGFSGHFHTGVARLLLI